MKHPFNSLIFTCVLLGAVLPVAAHHAVAAKFDPAKPITLTGPVSEIDWANPHVHIFINVPNGKDFTNWAIELESTVDLRRNGWTRESVKIGEPVTVHALPARDGSKQAWASTVTTSAGKRVFTVAAPQPPPKPTPPRATPRWPDGQPRLGPPPGQSGYWGFPSTTALVQ